MQTMKILNSRYLSPAVGMAGLLATAILLGIVRGPAVAAVVLALCLLGFAAGYALRRAANQGKAGTYTTRLAAVTAKADERLISLVEVAPEPVLVCAGGLVVYANRAAVDALRCDKRRRTDHARIPRPGRRQGSRVLGRTPARDAVQRAAGAVGRDCLLVPRRKPRHPGRVLFAHRVSRRARHRSALP
jgi:PAS domain-containing protein